MASSPAHRFGQIIGDLLEEIMLPLLQDFCDNRRLYLDKKGIRSARKGKKVTWLDKYENAHDLDFVIERGGSDSVVGRPVAFIEAAWRRYTKHSKNKVQEIQGAILPITEKHEWDKPFVGAILAGLFTEPSLKQMESSGFNVALFSYPTILTAFNSVGIDVRFDEQTPDAEFSTVISQIVGLPPLKREHLKSALVNLNQQFLKDFFGKLAMSLDRQIKELILIPLHGNTYTFNSLDDMIKFIDKYDGAITTQAFLSYRVFIIYSNNSNINAEFNTKEEVYDFLNYIAMN